MLKSVSEMFLRSHLCPLKTVFAYFESWFCLGVCGYLWCDVIRDISLVSMCLVSLQQDCFENKINLSTLQRCIAKICSENVLTKVSVLNSWRARRQEMLNSFLDLIHLEVIFCPKFVQAYSTNNPNFLNHDFLSVGTLRKQNEKMLKAPVHM